MTMEYKTLLRLLNIPNLTEFDTHKAAAIVATDIVFTEGFEGAPSIARHASVKRVSNDLNRLYRMGFLNRKRQKRQVPIGGGKLCFRGYKYMYRISKQGRQYLDYLNNPQPMPRPAVYTPGRFEDLVLIEHLRNQLPFEEKKYAEEIYGAMFDSYVPVGRYKRFPRKNAGSGLVILLKHYRDKLTEAEEIITSLKEKVQLLQGMLPEKGSAI